jgi:uroporphyrinogen-III synthase
MNNKPRILITRPFAEAEKLAHVLREENFDPVVLPAMEIQAYDNDLALDEALLKSDKLIFVSRNAVKHLLDHHAQQLKNFKGAILAIGEGTASELYACGIKEVLYPSPPYTSESLVEMPELDNLLDQQITIFSGLGGREFLAQTLIERGADVMTIATYQRQKITYTPETLQNAFDNIVCTVSTSMESLQDLVEIVAASPLHTFLLATPLLVISHNMVNLAKKIGFSNHLLVAPGADDTSILETLNQWIANLNAPLYSNSSALSY